MRYRGPKKGPLYNKGWLEVEDDSASDLDIVLRLMEEPGAHVVALRAERNARIPPVVSSAAKLDRV